MCRWPSPSPNSAKPRRIIYVNVEFERLTGRAAADLEGSPWSALPGEKLDHSGERLGELADEGQDYIGAFVIDRADGASEVDVWSNVIVGDDEQPLFRLIALAIAGRTKRRRGGTTSPNGFATRMSSCANCSIGCATICR